MDIIILFINMNNIIEKTIASVAWDGTPSKFLSLIRCMSQLLSDYIGDVWETGKTIFQRHVGFALKPGLALLCYGALVSFFSFCASFSVWRQ